MVPSRDGPVGGGPIWWLAAPAAARRPSGPPTAAGAAQTRPGAGPGYSTRPMKLVRSSQSGSVVALQGGSPKPAGTLGYE